MPPRLGIIAGGGALPVLITQECVKSGKTPFVIVLKGQADEENFADIPHTSFRIGAAGAVIHRLRKEGIEDLAFAGHLSKPSMENLRPDGWTASFLTKFGVFSKGDNSLLGALIEALEGEGFHVHGVDDVLPDLLTLEGCLTDTKPSAKNETDIEAGRDAALKLGQRDIGQAVVASNGRIIAEEDTRGTDAMLGNLTNNQGAGGVMVKVVKPSQERRIDLPTIGTTTIDNAIAANLAGIALSAGSSLIIEKNAVINEANRSGLFVVGIAGTKLSGNTK